MVAKKSLLSIKQLIESYPDYGRFAFHTLAIQLGIELSDEEFCSIVTSTSENEKDWIIIYCQNRTIKVYIGKDKYCVRITPPKGDYFIETCHYYDNKKATTERFLLVTDDGRITVKNNNTSGTIVVTNVDSTIKRTIEEDNIYTNENILAAKYRRFSNEFQTDNISQYKETIYFPGMEGLYYSELSSVCGEYKSEASATLTVPDKEVALSEKTYELYDRIGVYSKALLKRPKIVYACNYYEEDSANYLNLEITKIISSLCIKLSLNDEKSRIVIDCSRYNAITITDLQLLKEKLKILLRGNPCLRLIIMYLDNLIIKATKATNVEFRNLITSLNYPYGYLLAEEIVSDDDDIFDFIINNGKTIGRVPRRLMENRAEELCSLKINELISRIKIPDIALGKSSRRTKH